jgi:hypothetical protein
MSSIPSTSFLRAAILASTPVLSFKENGSTS